MFSQSEAIDKAYHFALRAISVTFFNLLSDVVQINSLVLEAITNTVGNPTILCILGSWMFFNLKDAAEHGVNVGTNWSLYTHSAIHFDEQQDLDDP